MIATFLSDVDGNVDVYLNQVKFQLMSDKIDAFINNRNFSLKFFSIFKTSKILKKRLIDSRYSVSRYNQSFFDRQIHFNVFLYFCQFEI